MEDVKIALALLLDKEVTDPLLCQCAGEAVEEILSWCAIETLPPGCVPIAARRAAQLYEGRDVQSVRRGDLTVTYGGGEQNFYRSLLPYRRMRF